VEKTNQPITHMDADLLENGVLAPWVLSKMENFSVLASLD